jgi:hypothetical protein
MCKALGLNPSTIKRIEMAYSRTGAWNTNEPRAHQKEVLRKKYVYTYGSMLKLFKTNLKNLPAAKARMRIIIVLLYIGL